MKVEQIFIGDIKKCTKYEEHITFSDSEYIDGQCAFSDSFGYFEEDDELYKENAILLKIKKGGFVDLEKFNSILDYIRINKDITKDGYILGGLMMSTYGYCEGNLFVDENSLKPYYPEQQQSNNISVRKLKREIVNNK